MSRLRRLKNNCYANFNNVNIIKKEKNGDYNIIIKRKIKNEFINSFLSFESNNDVLFFKEFGLFKVQNYFINVNNLVFVNVKERDLEKVRVEFIFNNMSYETILKTNFFNHWENHYL